MTIELIKMKETRTWHRWTDTQTKVILFTRPKHSERTDKIFFLKGKTLLMYFGSTFCLSKEGNCMSLLLLDSLNSPRLSIGASLQCRSLSLF